MKKWLLLAGLIMAVAATVFALDPPASGAAKPAAPGQPQTVVIATQSPDEVRVRQLEGAIRALRADVDALKERVAKLEASAQK